MDRITKTSPSTLPSNVDSPRTLKDKKKNLLSRFCLSHPSNNMPQGTLELLLVSAKGLENTDFLCKCLS
ncbi:hypothetical protein SLEP1_g8678 [Rubroshorea leprosula]|uniref:Uncharacterized protein n=1 Tax=Rubroshorea leprosula TaxID=152421 RepID=A0AAV5I2F7_9ROSI|nr:hypothetical protein SLEP1_g8678 [Rubroshorea leprosula]